MTESPIPLAQAINQLRPEFVTHDQIIDNIWELYQSTTYFATVPRDIITVISQYLQLRRTYNNACLQDNSEITVQAKQFIKKYKHKRSTTSKIIMNIDKLSADFPVCKELRDESINYRVVKIWVKIINGKTEIITQKSCVYNIYMCSMQYAGEYKVSHAPIGSGAYWVASNTSHSPILENNIEYDIRQILPCGLVIAQIYPISSSRRFTYLLDFATNQKILIRDFNDNEVIDDFGNSVTYTDPIKYLKMSTHTGAYASFKCETTI